MITQLPVKLIKKEKLDALAVEPNRWATAVRSWVTEFQQHRLGESLPAFDSLFKDALLRSAAGIR